MQALLQPVDQRNGSANMLLCLFLSSTQRPYFQQKERVTLQVGLVSSEGVALKELKESDAAGLNRL